MFCMNCGEKLPDEAKFCFSCGENIGSKIVKGKGKIIKKTENVLEPDDEIIEIRKESTKMLFINTKESSIKNDESNNEKKIIGRETESITQKNGNLDEPKHTLWKNNDEKEIKQSIFCKTAQNRDMQQKNETKITESKIKNKIIGNKRLKRAGLLLISKSYFLIIMIILNSFVLVFDSDKKNILFDLFLYISWFVPNIIQLKLGKNIRKYKKSSIKLSLITIFSIILECIIIFVISYFSHKSSNSIFGDSYGNDFFFSLFIWYLIPFFIIKFLIQEWDILISKNKSIT